MLKKTTVITAMIITIVSTVYAAEPTSVIKTDIVTISVRLQHESVLPGSTSALAIRFDLEENWHFYADEKSAPGAMNLKITPVAEALVNFEKPIFPESESYFDKSLDKQLQVFSDKFIVYLPFIVSRTEFEGGRASTEVKISIEGAVCSNMQCRVPDFEDLTITIQISSDAMGKPEFALPDRTQPPADSLKKNSPSQTSYPVLFAFGLALLAGLSLNIMPCVWPVLPIIVMRVVEQAKQNKTKSIAMGLTFCLGILLFFASLAAANIILQLAYGTVLQWGDPFRIPIVVTVMSLLLVVLALFMFGLFTIVVPSSVTSKSGSGKGFTGALGMGFLAAILSTPCSFAILASAFAWSQAQPLSIGTLAIMIIGLGMAAPYAILTSMPGLLKRLPKAGRWMEIFKQAIGFVLLAIAVKLITALPQAARSNVLYFAVVLGFAVWMWGTWVTFGTKLVRKWTIRIIAVAIAAVAGWFFLKPSSPELIKWQKYDAVMIEKTLAEDRPVLIKFTADWCLSCQLVEKTVYSRPDISNLIEQKNVLPIKADTTARDYPATLALKNIYKEPGVPVTILLDASAEKPVRWHGLAFADELKKHLEELPPK